MKLNAAAWSGNTRTLWVKKSPNVVNSVKGDPTHGENGALYASFGNVRKDDRKSGLTRATNVVPAPTELKAAAQAANPSPPEHRTKLAGPVFFKGTGQRRPSNAER